ncbi:hypothetical protein KR032_011784 [Drosophila birchii]|nr:hypothetical protein KR032_011784 [Drosophila birchii]
MLSPSPNERSYLHSKYDSSSFKRSASFSPATTPSSGHKERRSETSYYENRQQQNSGSRRRSRTRSRSRSRSQYQGAVPRHHSGRTPRDRQRMYEARDRPAASRCIGVFGLNTNTTQHKVRELFNKFGPIERIQMVIDAHTQRSRGFCFIYFESLKDAKVAKDACSGIEVDGRRIRVDFSITQRAHTPTPGVYMGRPSRGYSNRPERRRDRSFSPNDVYRPRSNYQSDRRSFRKSYSRSRYVRSRSRTRSRSRSRNSRRMSSRY